MPSYLVKGVFPGLPQVKLIYIAEVDWASLACQVVSLGLRKQWCFAVSMESDVDYVESRGLYSYTEERLPGGWPLCWGPIDAQDFIRKGQICRGERDEGNVKTFQKSRVGGRPVETNSEEIRVYSSVSYSIFVKGVGIPAPICHRQYFCNEMQQKWINKKLTKPFKIQNPFLLLESTDKNLNFYKSFYCSSFCTY